MTTTRAIVFGCCLVIGEAVASPAAVELERAEDIIKPVAFAVDATHVYVAFENYDSIEALGKFQHREDGIALGIYARSDGSQAASVDAVDLWTGTARAGLAPFVAAVPYKDGAVVSAMAAATNDAYLSFVDRTGGVRARTRVADFITMSLGRHRNSVLAASNERVALFDENLELQHDWIAPDTILLLARPMADDIVVLDGVRNQATWMLSGSIRWLAVGDRITQRLAVEVPIDFAFPPSPKLLTWQDGMSLFVFAEYGWQECRLGPDGAGMACGQPAWGDLRALPDIDEYAVHDLIVVRSGEGYAAIMEDGCAAWTRRYDRSGLLAERQFVVPKGSSSLGRVHGLLASELDAGVFMLTSGFLNGTAPWDGDYRIVLRELASSASAPLLPHPRTSSCWDQVAAGMTHEPNVGIRAITAADVNACRATGADPNAASSCDGWRRPLGFAAETDNADGVQALLAAGAHVDAQDGAGDTALHRAARYAKSPTALKALLDGGADVTLRNNAGRTAWDEARRNDALRGADAVRLLRHD